MEKQVHPNFIKSSNLIFLTLVLGLINMLFSNEILSNAQNIATAAFTFLFVAGLAYLVRQGKGWVKYLLVVMLILGIVGMPFIISNIIENPIVGLINIAQTVLQVWAAVLLFRVSKISHLKPNYTNS